MNHFPKSFLYDQQGSKSLNTGVDGHVFHVEKVTMSRFLTRHNDRVIRRGTVALKRIHKNTGLLRW